MSNDIVFADEYVEIYGNRVEVIYDSHRDNYDLSEIAGAKLFVERDVDDRPIWLDLFIFGPLLTLVLRPYRNLRWTLTLETTSGPADIFTSPNGMYLSKVRRAINKAIKARGVVPTTA